MKIEIACSVDRQRGLWIATAVRYPEFIAEARTVDELRELFPAALEAASLPPDATLQVRFFYPHDSRGVALFAMASAAGNDGIEVEREGGTVNDVR
jgi:hypothetical protein